MLGHWIRAKSMISHGKTWLALPALFWAAGAVAMPPPLSLPITIISDDREAEAVGEAFLAILHKHGLLDRESYDPPLGQLWNCMKLKDDQQECIRHSTDWKTQKAAVVVLATGKAEQDWTCIGVASAPTDLQRQTVRIHVQQGIFGTAEQRKLAMDLAGQCIVAAGAESGW
jgi:hypothetical protein